MSEPVRLAVVGAGAFGRNHLRVARALEAEGAGVVLAAVVEPAAAAREVAAAEHALPGFVSVQELLASAAEIDAAVVAVPTVHHATVALPLLEAGIHVLVEKPIAPSLADADAMIAAAERHGRVLQVGHLERFNPSVVAALPLVNRPMFFESHRLSIFTPRSLDVDVVLDLMIHDLDIVLALAASPVHEVRAVGLPVLSREVDIANVRVEFETGAVANFTASRVSTERVRKLRFFQPRQYLSLDFARQDLLVIDVAEGATPEQVAALAATGSASSAVSGGSAHPSAGLGLRKVPTLPGEPLRREVEAFLASVRDRTVPPVGGADGRRALALALEIQREMRAHGERSGLIR